MELVLHFDIQRILRSSKKILMLPFGSASVQNLPSSRFPHEIILYPYLSNLTAVGQGRGTSINPSLSWDASPSSPRQRRKRPSFHLNLDRESQPAINYLRVAHPTLCFDEEPEPDLAEPHFCRLLCTEEQACSASSMQ